MKKQVLTKKLVSLTLAAVGALTMTAGAFAYNVPPTEAPSNEVVVFASGVRPLRAYEYKWVYKTINGQVHKRLYNLTLDRYEGEWIPM